MKLVCVLSESDGCTFSCDITVPFEMESISDFKSFVLDKAKNALKNDFYGFALFPGVEVEVSEVLDLKELIDISNERRLIDALTIEDVSIDVFSLEEWFARCEKKFVVS